MRPFRELPLELKLFCPECKMEKVFSLSGLAQNGFFYTCQTCHRMRILSEEEIEYWITKQ